MTGQEAAALLRERADTYAHDAVTLRLNGDDMWPVYTAWADELRSLAQAVESDA